MNDSDQAAPPPTDGPLLPVTLRRPIDFFGIGGHACASTKLYHLMKAHPEIGFVHPSTEPGVDIRGKECHYFDRYYSKSIEWYLSNFEWDFPRVGEITPAYARLDAAAVSTVRSLFPCAHVFFIVRNTLERTWSNIRKNMAKMAVSDPTIAWMISQAEDEKTLLRNDYVRTASLWSAAFGSQFHLINFDDFISDPRRIMVQIAGLLRVDARFYEELGVDILRQRINPSPNLDMPGGFRSWYADNYLFDWTEQLQQMSSIAKFL